MNGDTDNGDDDDDVDKYYYDMAASLPVKNATRKPET